MYHIKLFDCRPSAALNPPQIPWSSIFNYTATHADVKFVKDILEEKQNNNYAAGYDSDSDSDDDSIDGPCKPKPVSTDNEEKIIDKLKVKKGLLLFCHIEINRKVTYVLPGQKSQQYDYHKTQMLLGHLFALRCWSVIEYIITTDIFKTTPLYPVNDLDDKECSVLKFLWREDKTLLNLLMKQSYFQESDLRDEEDRAVVNHIKKRLLLIAESKGEEIPGSHPTSIYYDIYQSLTKIGPSPNPLVPAVSLTLR